MEYKLTHRLEDTLFRKTCESDLSFKHAALIIKGKNIIRIDSNHRLESCNGLDFSIHAEQSLLQEGKGA